MFGEDHFLVLRVTEGKQEPLALRKGPLLASSLNTTALKSRYLAIRGEPEGSNIWTIADTSIPSLNFTFLSAQETVMFISKLMFSLTPSLRGNYTHLGFSSTTWKTFYGYKNES